MPYRNVTCFIASAFGREDVDAVYDQCVGPVLERLSIRAVRVDRVEHNHDIDKKILELLKASAFCIADLTYARPSAYYEAGYAAGASKPVVYIARSDHFRATNDDPAGNLRVHFDLQMKNIIPWTHPDEDFRSRLERRVRHVLRPLAAAQRRDHRLRERRLAFQQLSQYEKLSNLATKAKNILRRRGFSCNPPPADRVAYPWRFIGYREGRERHQAVIFLGVPSVTKQELERITPLGLLPFDARVHQTPQEGHYVYGSLRSTTRATVTDALSSYRPIGAASYHSALEPRGGLSRDLYVHIIDNIKSESEFSDHFRSLLAKQQLGKLST